jgi:hypothetical protein
MANTWIESLLGYPEELTPAEKSEFDAKIRKAKLPPDWKGKCKQIDEILDLYKCTANDKYRCKECKMLVEECDVEPHFRNHEALEQIAHEELRRRKLANLFECIANDEYRCTKCSVVVKACEFESHFRNEHDEARLITPDRETLRQMAREYPEKSQEERHRLAQEVCLRAAYDYAFSVSGRENNALGEKFTKRTNARAKY